MSTSRDEQQGTTWPPPLVPPAPPRSRVDRFKNEIAAGGSS